MFISKKTIYVLLFSIFLVACNGSEEESTATGVDDIKLTLADSVPTSNDVSAEGAVYFMDRVEELSDGQVEFDYYPAEQLGTAGTLLNLTQSKTTDIGYTTYSDELTLTEVGSLPGSFNSSEEGTKIIWELMDDFLLEEEYLKQGVRPLFTVSMPPYQIITKEQRLEDINSIQGLTIRTSGSIEHTIAALGASPVDIPAPEMYSALDLGTVDGAVVPITSYAPYQLEEIADYTTSNTNLGSFTVVYSINEEVFQELPEDIQNILYQAGEETMDHFSSHLDEMVPSLLEEFSSKMEVYEIDSNTLQEIDEKFEQVRTEWAQSLESNGLPGEEVLNRYEEIRESLQE